MGKCVFFSHRKMNISISSSIPSGQ